MSGVRKHYFRIVLVWIATLAALYTLQRYFS
jgi:hypothetical protein